MKIYKIRVRRFRCRFVLCHFVKVQIYKTVLLNTMQGVRFLPLQNVSLWHKDYFRLIGFKKIEVSKSFFFFVFNSVAKLYLTLWDPIDCSPNPMDGGAW